MLVNQKIGKGATGSLGKSEKNQFMKIAYYMPFKPMGHKNPSGDLVIGTELYRFFKDSGDDIFQISSFRLRWIYLKPHLWPLLFLECIRVCFFCLKKRPDIWLSYHSYYKAPDILGALVCRLLGIPYTVFQGVYSTKRRRAWKTKPGFYLNRFVLRSALVVFTNKMNDYNNLLRIQPEKRVTYIAPGLHPDHFLFDSDNRLVVRNQLGIGQKLVIMSVAMFRDGVKTRGIQEVIQCCSKLREKGIDFLLLIAGDGQNRQLLEKYGRRELEDCVLFVGRLDRTELGQYYSAADIFIFPGVNESLGMVYLEAQSCGLPVVAYKEWGAGEAVVDNVTGFLSSSTQGETLADNLEKLCVDRSLRKRMGMAGEKNIREKHDIEANYKKIRLQLKQLLQSKLANSDP